MWGSAFAILFAFFLCVGEHPDDYSYSNKDDDETDEEIDYALGYCCGSADYFERKNYQQYDDYQQESGNDYLFYIFHFKHSLNLFPELREHGEEVIRQV